jgi:hypothetical protein
MDAPFVGDIVEARQAQCVAGSPLRGRGYYIGLDPSRGAENRKVVKQFLEQMERWRQARPVPRSPLSGQAFNLDTLRRNLAGPG